MKGLISLHILKTDINDCKNVKILYSFRQSSFSLFSSNVSEISEFLSYEIVKRIKLDEIIIVNQNDYKILSVRIPTHGITIITDCNYNVKISQMLANEVINFINNSISDPKFVIKDRFNELFKKYQNQNEINKIMTVINDMDNTNKILVRDFNQILDKGEKLDDILNKSDQLSFSSRAILKTIKIPENNSNNNNNKVEEIKEEIKQTKEILEKSIYDLLERGEKLDEIVDKTDQLSKNSKTFLKMAEKTNRCCQIL